MVDEIASWQLTSADYSAGYILNGATAPTMDQAMTHFFGGGGPVRNAKVSIVHLDEALTYLNAQRARVGAWISRLENTIANLATGSEAGSASLAQANTQQGRVLQWLR
jgi:flagellin-like hook-associated protein FlgL